MYAMRSMMPPLSLAYRFFTMGLLVASFATKMFFCLLIVQLHSKDKKAYECKSKQLYAIVFYVSLAVSVPICVFAEPIIGILYGEAYLLAVASLRIIV